jgi:hypothetical protein
MTVDMEKVQMLRKAQSCGVKEDTRQLRRDVVVDEGKRRC